MSLLARAALAGLAWLAVPLPLEALDPAKEQSLQARLDAAEEGSVIRVEAGVYEGPLRIDKAVSLIGVGQPVIDGGHLGHVVRIVAPDVRLEGFVIRNSGDDLSKDHAGVMIQGDRARIEGNRIENALHGIYLKKAGDCLVAGNRILGKETKLVPVEDVLTEGLRLTPDGEMCIVDLDVNQRGNGIHLWNSSGNQLEGNVIRGTRDGIYFSFSDRTSVRDNHVSRTRYGLHYMYSDENVFEGNRFEMNAAGAAIMYSNGLFVRGNRFQNNQGRRAYGLLLQSLEDTTIIGNAVERNTVGIYLENSNRNVFRGNAVSSNYIGVRFTASSQDNAFTRNDFSANLHSVELDGKSDANDWSPGGEGNFWSGSRPVDLDGDGFGEFGHREADLLGRHRREFPLVGLLSNTPALQLLQLAQSKVPLPGVSAIEDAAPLTRAAFGDD